MQILLIEDELPAARQLTRLLHACDPGLQVLDTLDSVENAVNWLRTFPAPDLIFMDIQIADGLSFDIFNQATVTAPVIFTTAFDQYALQAFKVSAVDYLLKPIDPAELEQALQKVKQRQSAIPVDLAALARFFQPQSYKDRFLVKAGQQMNLLRSADIAYFRSDGGLTQAFSNDHKKHFVDHTLDELERLLDPREFFRVSRSLTVRIDAIVRVAPHFNGRLKLELKPAPPEETFVSRDRAAAFKVWLGG
ncbi:MAG: response regulator transcription factor [Saprospiraceae bacterium]|nr:response regulator transcription factor [Saprospiraceae bacterium]